MLGSLVGVWRGVGVDGRVHGEGQVWDGRREAGGQVVGRKNSPRLSQPCHTPDCLSRATRHRPPGQSVEICAIRLGPPPSTTTDPAVVVLEKEGPAY